MKISSGPHSAAPKEFLLTAHREAFSRSPKTLLCVLILLSGCQSASNIVSAQNNVAKGEYLSALGRVALTPFALGLDIIAPGTGQWKYDDALRERRALSNPDQTYSARPSKAKPSYATSLSSNILDYQCEDIVLQGKEGSSGGSETGRRGMGGDGGQGGSGPGISVNVASYSATDGGARVVVYEVSSDMTGTFYCLRRSGSAPLRVASIGGDGGNGGAGRDGRSEGTINMPPRYSRSGVTLGPSFTIGRATAARGGGDGGDGGPGGSVHSTVSERGLVSVLNPQSLGGAGGLPGPGGTGGTRFATSVAIGNMIVPGFTQQAGVASTGEAAFLGRVGAVEVDLDTRVYKDIASRAPPQVRQFIQLEK